MSEEALDPMQVFGYRLRKIRTEFGYSQNLLGRLSNMANARVRISYYESGRRHPDQLTVANLAKVFNVPVAYFYAHTEELAQAIIKFHRGN